MKKIMLVISIVATLVILAFIGIKYMENPKQYQPFENDLPTEEIINVVEEKVLINEEENEVFSESEVEEKVESLPKEEKSKPETKSKIGEPEKSKPIIKEEPKIEEVIEPLPKSDPVIKEEQKHKENEEVKEPKKEVDNDYIEAMKEVEYLTEQECFDVGMKKAMEDTVNILGFDVREIYYGGKIIGYKLIIRYNNPLE